MTVERTTSGERVRWPAGFRLQKLERALLLDCPFEPPGWRPRQVGDQIRSDHAGTAVRYEGELFEVVAAEGFASSHRLRYRLESWDDRFLVRAPVDLGPGSCRAWHGAHSRRRGDARKGWALHWLAPFVGLLPAVDQERLESRFAVSAARATLFSAGLVATLALPIVAVGLLSQIVPGFTAGHPWMRRSTVLLLPAAYLLGESWVRLNLAMREGRAVGSLPVVLVVQGARELRPLVARRSRTGPSRRP